MDYIDLDEALEKLDARAERIRKLMLARNQAQLTELWKQLDISMIYHSCALEGQVLSFEELNAAFNSGTVTDVSSLPLNHLIRSHMRAIELSRELAARKNLVFSVDLFREFHALLCSDSNEGRIGRYRKEIPLHRAYFHEIYDPSRISSSMRDLITWLNNPLEAQKVHPIRWVAKFHLRFMRIFPFAESSGKIGRITMNMMLVRHGYLPAIIHATDRQSYYEAIRQPPSELTSVILESAASSLDAAEKFLRRSALAS